jgi:hypothetical protein
MNIVLGFVGENAEVNFGRLMSAANKHVQVDIPLNIASSQDGRAIFGLRQPGGFYPLEKPFYSPEEKVLCLLQGYFWFHGHFPQNEIAAKEQILRAVNQITQVGQLILSSEDGGLFNSFVFNEKTGTLHINNDYSGVFPLYYSTKEDGLSFGSHLRPLVKALQKEYDPISIIQKTAFHYTIGKRTIYNEIFRLNPGEALEYSIKTNSIKTYQTKRIYSNIINYKNDYEAAEAIYSDFLSGAAELSRVKGMRGIMLSGGLDSRLVAIGFHNNYCPILSVIIGENNNSEVQQAIRVASELDSIFKVVSPISDCQFQSRSIPNYIDEIETVNFIHFNTPGKTLKELGAVCISTGYGGDTLLGGDAYSLYGKRYRKENRFKNSLLRELGLPFKFSADFSEYPFNKVQAKIKTYYNNLLDLKTKVFEKLWIEKYKDDVISQTFADIDYELTRYQNTNPELPLQIFERFWRDHQELQTAEILTTLNNHLPIVLPTMHHTFVERCSNLSPDRKFNHGIYLLLVKKYFGKLNKIPTGNISLPLNYPGLFLLASRVIRTSRDNKIIKLQMKSHGEFSSSRYGWTNFEKWFRAGNILEQAREYIDSSIYSKDKFNQQISSWINWDEKIYSGQDLLTMITISQMIK